MTNERGNLMVNPGETPMECGHRWAVCVDTRFHRCTLCEEVKEVSE